jgi:hypothetical protein
VIRGLERRPVVVGQQGALGKRLRGTLGRHAVHGRMTIPPPEPVRTGRESAAVASRRSVSAEQDGAAPTPTSATRGARHPAPCVGSTSDSNGFAENAPRARAASASPGGLCQPGTSASRRRRTPAR